jgi:UDP-N-acetylglucosamine transferase subunit ALG13
MNAWRMAVQLPHVLRVIHQEHVRIEKIVLEESIDCVVSDNRYGAWSARVPSVFMGHQLTAFLPPPAHWAQPFFNIWHSRWLKRFTRIWIPDDPEVNLAGKLKHNPGLSVEHVGLLSRFDGMCDRQPSVPVVVVLSGPEPARSTLEEILIAQLEQSGVQAVVVRGVISENEPLRHSTVKVINFLPAHALEQLLSSATLVIARSGYSTVMDLWVLRKKALFIPTPGQTEQEYLARRLKENGLAHSVDQHRLALATDMEKALQCKGLGGGEYSATHLQKAIERLALEKL